MVAFIFPASFAAELEARFIDDIHVCPNGELEVVEGLDHELYDWLIENASRYYKFGW